VKASGLSPVEAGLFPASMSEETAEKEGIGSHGQRREGLGGGERRGHHLLPLASADDGRTVVQRPPPATTRADAGGKLYRPS
jgi:hypothetical protein